MQLSDAIRQVAAEFVKGQSPSGVMYGTVRSVSPLSVDINPKLKLSAVFLMVAQHLSDYEIPIDIEVDGVIDLTPGRLILHNGLRVGDRVVLARLEGGQQYAILDRVR